MHAAIDDKQVLCAPDPGIRTYHAAAVILITHVCGTEVVSASQDLYESLGGDVSGHYQYAAWLASVAQEYVYEYLEGIVITVGVEEGLLGDACLAVPP